MQENVSAVAKNQYASNRRQTLPIALFLALLSSACSKGIDTVEWSEEVKLSNDQTIVIWRKAVAHTNGFPNTSRGEDIEYELKYGALHLSWKTIVTYDHVRNPIAFDIIDGTPLLVLYGSEDVCKDKKPTDYTAQFLKWEKGLWIDVPQSSFPTEKVLKNLGMNYWGSTPKDDYKGFITWGKKASDDLFRAEAPDSIKTYFERGHRLCNRFEQGRISSKSYAALMQVTF